MRAAKNKQSIIEKADKEITFISLNELKMIGIALYWAEGHKTGTSSGVDFINTDPQMIKLMIRWFKEICHVPENKFRIRIQLHNANDINKAKIYWSQVTGISESQFTKTYVKVSSSSKRKMGNLTPYGTCSIRISDINLITRIKSWINKIAALSSSLV